MRLALINIMNTLGLILISPAGYSYYQRESILHPLPLLLIWSKDDPIIPFSEAEVFREKAKNLSTLFFDTLQKKGEAWRAHSAQSERPDEVNAAIIKFVQQLK
ncbi:MAG: alpha/beta fold hydrolase [Candidatus Heimdallarchaeaceae archaeon]